MTSGVNCVVVVFPSLLVSPTKCEREREIYATLLVAADQKSHIHIPLLVCFKKKPPRRGRTNAVIIAIVDALQGDEDLDVLGGQQHFGGTARQSERRSAERGGSAGRFARLDRALED